MATVTYFGFKIVFPKNTIVKPISCITDVREKVECRNNCIRLAGDNEKAFYIKDNNKEWVLECWTDEHFSRDGVKTLSFYRFGHIEGEKIVFDGNRPKFEEYII